METFLRGFHCNRLAALGNVSLHQPSLFNTNRRGTTNFVRRGTTNVVPSDDVDTVIEQTSSVTATTSGLSATTLESALCYGDKETEIACTATVSSSLPKPVLIRVLTGAVPLTAPVSSISGISAQVKTTVLKTVCSLVFSHDAIPLPPN